ncbi:hypothetical protein LCGC14_1127990, partial [marine sediment metagenome]
PDESILTVGTSPTRILRNNPSRVAWIITNYSASIIYVGFSSGILADAGLYLSPGGGSIKFAAMEDGMVVVNEVWGIAGAAGLTVATTEIIIDAVRMKG